MTKAPNATSSDYDAMLPFWQMVDDIMGGAPAMRKAGEKYLPRFEKESKEEHEQRVEVSPFTPLYADAFRNLASKPFSDEVKLGEDAPENLKPLVEDIDTAGSHLHVFAREVFKGGVNYGVDWIFVDKIPLPQRVSLAAERAAGARPYWVRVPARRMLAVYQDSFDGKFQIVHARIDETIKVRDGYGEREIKRVRELDREPIHNGEKIVGYGPAGFKLWQERKDNQGQASWELIDSGSFAIGVIPLVPFVTGERENGSWRMRPPLYDLAYMQVTEFQMESNRSRIQTMTAFPVNVFQGVPAPEKEEDRQVSLGPRSVIWIEPGGEGVSHGNFRREEPSGAASTMLREDLAEFRREMREIGMQPLTPQSGNLTATATAVAEAKAHSAVEVWALALKDALEQAFVFTCMWMGLSEKDHPDVVVHTDFAVGRQSVEEMGVVKDLHDDHLISGDQRLDEAVRRGILGPTYDREKDKKRRMEEEPGDPTDEEIRAAMLEMPLRQPEPEPEPEPEPA